MSFAFIDQRDFGAHIHARHQKQLKPIVDRAHRRYQVMTDAAADQGGKISVGFYHGTPPN